MFKIDGYNNTYSKILTRIVRTNFILLHVTEILKINYH